jgi:hypothetical protein
VQSKFDDNNLIFPSDPAAEINSSLIFKSTVIRTSKVFVVTHYKPLFAIVHNFIDLSLEAVAILSLSIEIAE